MHPEIKALWLDALPRYRQATDRLREGDTMSDDVARFCCLGVLCDLSKQGEWADNERVTAYSTGDGDPQEFCLPIPVMKWAGIDYTDHNPTNVAGSVPLPFAPRDFPDDSMTLAKANDSGCTFPQIADLIRAFL